MFPRLAIAQQRQQQQRRLFHAARGWRQGQVSSIIKVDNASFYRESPSQCNDAPLYEKLSFSLPTGLERDKPPEFWAIVSPSSLARTNFLQILQGRHFCSPPSARTYPYLADISRAPHDALQYIGFDADRGSRVGGNGVRGAYLSARYEARREETDYSLHNYLTGHTELNALEQETSAEESEALENIVTQLDLRPLLTMPVANLSNGQTRRARIAKALMARPEVLLLDGPFMGLDPNTSCQMAKLLRTLAESHSPRVIISLRPEDGVPRWISHLIVADSNSRILGQGPKPGIRYRFRHLWSSHITTRLGSSTTTTSKSTPQEEEEEEEEEHQQQQQQQQQQRLLSKDAHPYSSSALPLGEPIIQMCGVQIAYNNKLVLGNFHQTNPTTLQPYPTPGLHWSLHRGQRTAIFGPNGSGKTTLLSLITSDHPQTYSQPILHFSRSRLPSQGEAGISLFDLQSRIGHSSPEIHAFFPKHLSVRQVLESAWAETPLSKPKLTAKRDRLVDATLRWFARELNPFMKQGDLTSLEQVARECSVSVRTSHSASKKQRSLRTLARAAAKAAVNEILIDDSDLEFGEIVKFRDLCFGSQRLLLFLRALVGTPDLVVLDEAFSGLDSTIRDKALLWLSHGEKIECVIEKGTVAVESVQSWVKGGGGGEEVGEEEAVVVDDGKVVFKGLENWQALVVVAHAKEDVPGCVREWICLPQGEEEGREPRVGRLEGPLEFRGEVWDRDIWGEEEGRK